MVVKGMGRDPCLSLENIIRDRVERGNSVTADVRLPHCIAAADHSIVVIVVGPQRAPIGRSASTV